MKAKFQKIALAALFSILLFSFENCSPTSLRLAAQDPDSDMNGNGAGPVTAVDTLVTILCVQASACVYGVDLNACITDLMLQPGLPAKFGVPQIATCEGLRADTLAGTAFIDATASASCAVTIQAQPCSLLAGQTSITLSLSSYVPVENLLAGTCANVFRITP